MVSAEVVNRARRNAAIEGRYDAQELIRIGGRYENVRRDWTPAQKRRMRKQKNRGERAAAARTEAA